jgi:hypothetical protein
MSRKLRRLCRQQNVRFETWADKWLESLERKETTVDSYRSTIAYAKDTFGHVLVRRLGSGHLAELNEAMKEKELSASTRAKRSSSKVGQCGSDWRPDAVKAVSSRGHRRPTVSRPRPQ